MPTLVISTISITPLDEDMIFLSKSGLGGGAEHKYLITNRSYLLVELHDS